MPFCADHRADDAGRTVLSLSSASSPVRTRNLASQARETGLINCVRRYVTARVRRGCACD
jgi:hypothetical protein